MHLHRQLKCVYVSHVLVFRSKTRAAKRSERHYPAGASHTHTHHSCLFFGKICFINVTVASDPFHILFAPFKSCMMDVMESLFLVTACWRDMWKCTELSLGFVILYFVYTNKRK